MKEFWTKCQALGHSKERIQNGHEVTTYFSVASLQEARALLSNANPESRKQRSRLYFEELGSRSALRMGLHDRGEGFVFADEPYPAGDQSFIDQHLPFRVKAFSVLSKELLAGEVWDVSVSPNQWGLHLGEDTYVILNIGTLTLHPGAAIIVKGNVLSMLCQRLVKVEHSKAIHQAAPYDIGILPTPQGYWPAHAPVFQIYGAHGQDGKPGQHGVSGSSIKTGSGLFGPTVPDEMKAALNGDMGENGTDGERGSRGANGAICKLAEITVHDIATEDRPMIIHAQAGPGGHGGDGGNGGNGGTGGNGVNGLASTPGGNAGHGGNGGAGGKGGPGGNGGLSSHIFINVPPAQASLVKRVSLPSQGGSGGSGGSGGKPGLPGLPGIRPVPGLMGKRGQKGLQGKDGNSGRSRPAAKIYLNEKL